MKSEKIIIICPSMWPNMNMWGETQRMFYLANHLAEQGRQILVISPAYETHRTVLELKDQKYKNFYLGNIVRKRQNAQTDKSLLRKKLMCKLRHRISVILNLCGEWMYGEPDFIEVWRKKIWIKRYKNEICRIVREEKADKVIISVPSFTLMKLGILIKKCCRDIKIIYDYRDPWYLWHCSKNLAYYREKNYLKCADCVVGFSERFRFDMIEKMGLDPLKIYTVYNGYSEFEWRKFEKESVLATTSEIENLSSKMVITYTGYMSLSDKKDNYRNPNNLIKAVKGISDVELYLVGISKVQKEIIEENIHFVGEVAQQQSFAYMNQSNVLISIHDTNNSSGEYLISGKFYDYMRSGKVILHIGKDKDLMAKLINELDLGVVCENQIEQLREEILKLRALWKEGRLIRKVNNTKYIEQFSRERQNDTYKQIIDRVSVL